MKKMVKKGIALLAGTAICLGGVAGFLPTVTANAGKSEQKVVTGEMYKDELSNQKWYFTRDIAHEEGKIVFNKATTTEESKIVSVILANDLREMGIDTCINGSFTVKVTDALDGEFYVGFGLDRPYEEVNSASAICLYDNGGTVGVKVENFTEENAGKLEVAAQIVALVAYCQFRATGCAAKAVIVKDNGFGFVVFFYCLFTNQGAIFMREQIVGVREGEEKSKASRTGYA